MGVVFVREDRRRRFELQIVRFLERMRVAGFSPRTIDSYRSHIGFFLAWLDRETNVEEVTAVTPEILHGYQTWLYGYTDDGGRGLAIATQAARLSVVRAFFRWLVKTDVLLYDPAAGLELPKRKGILPRSVLTKKEVERLLAAPDVTTPLGLRDRAMLEVLYSTGIRNAELRALTVYDLDLDRGLVRINEGKNAKDRVVPLGEVACRWLREYLDVARPKLLVRDNAGEQTVFLSKNGRPLLPLGVIDRIRRLAKAAGIERPVTPHSMRHTFATHMLRGRADIRHIQAMLGHASVATTQIYTRVEVTDLKTVHRRCHPREKR
ncbi:MAG: tyrosine-type recombinase/integrase [Acidobacteriota bacterium]|nr:tyrosine-type recombinase/integrase [Acidobacteriota bacterium]